MAAPVPPVGVSVEVMLQRCRVMAAAGLEGEAERLQALAAGLRREMGS